VRTRDILCAPNLLTVARLPLAVAFPFVAGRRRIALGVVAAAAATDVLDGWLARKLGRVTTFGAVADGIADKAFAASVVGTLIARRLLSPTAALVVFAREIGEAILAARALVTGRPLATYTANVPGKVTTSLELATVVCALARLRGRTLLVVATSLTSVVAAIAYWRRELTSNHART
jgi:cardiolipin synthase (CMP-forming)